MPVSMGKAGRDAQRCRQLDADVPTMAEAGYAGVELEIWQGIVAPAGTPPAIARKLNTELIRAAQSPDVLGEGRSPSGRDDDQHAGGFRQAARLRYRAPRQADPRRRNQGAIAGCSRLRAVAEKLTRRSRCFAVLL
jgi:hypothetical protein